ncbi:MAG: hypothetical protein ACTSR7_15140 [Promethearchaeota archaeon]
MDDFTEGNSDKWKWTIMIMQPDWVTYDMINEGISITNQNFQNYFLNSD